MRWSQLAFTFSLVGALSLSACRRDSDPQQPSAPPPPPQSLTKHTATEDGLEMRGRGTPQGTPQGHRVQMASPAQCFADLCTANQELALPEIFTKAGVGSEKQIAYFEKYIQPVLKNSMSVRFNMQRMIKEKVEKFQADFERVELDEDQRVVMASLVFFAKYKDLTDEARKNLMQALNESPQEKANSESVLRGPEGYLATLYPEIPLKDAVFNEALYIVRSREKLNKAAQSTIFTSTSQVLDRARNKETLDRSDLEAIQNDSLAIRRMIAVAYGAARRELDKMNFTTDKIYKFYVAGKYNKKASYTEYDDKDMKQCAVKFYQTLNLSPTTQQMLHFQGLMPQIQEASASILKEDDPARSVLKKTNFLMPLTANEWAQRWAKHYTAANRASQQAMDLMQNYDASQIYLVSLIDVITNKKVEPLCDDVFSAQIDDAIAPDKGNSRLSWFTVKYPQYGISVMAHELGHVMYTHGLQFENEKSCVKGQNGNEFYSSEDIADLLAIRAENVLTKKVSVKVGNVGCAFASLNPAEGLINNDPTDPHSSNLMRAIRIAQYRKQALPSSCQSLLETQKPQASNACE